MKMFLGIVVGLVLLLAIAVFILSASFGSIITRGVNRYGPEYTQAKVELSSAKISPLSGHGELDKLFIGNPSGWASDHAFSLAKISVDVVPRSLFGDHVTVNSLVIDGADIVYETKLTSSNLQDLLKNIQQATGPSETAKAPEQPAKQPKIEVKNLVLSNAKITVVAAGRTQVVNVPSITMENLGTEQGGLTPPALSAAILKEISRQAIQAAAQGFWKNKSINQAASGLLKVLSGARKPDSTPATNATTP